MIDPDFIFLKPLTTWMSPVDTAVSGDGLSIEDLKLENGGWVRKGYPAGELDDDRLRKRRGNIEKRRRANDMRGRKYTS